jgi:hypothetical protein
MDLTNKLRSQGVGFVCACCEKLRRRAVRGLLCCEAAIDGKDCCGPISGGFFPLYEGPLTRRTIATTCFVCGDKATKVLVVHHGEGEYVGACDCHIGMCPVTDGEYESSKTMVPAEDLR